MNEQKKDVLLACCGLLCSQCGAYKKNKCQGCSSDKPMNLHCKVKPCVQTKGCQTCAECDDFEDLKECKKLHNFISRFFAFVFRSDRIGNLNRIKEIGADKFKEENH